MHWAAPLASRILVPVSIFLGFPVRFLVNVLIPQVAIRKAVINKVRAGLWVGTKHIVDEVAFCQAATQAAGMALVKCKSNTKLQGNAAVPSTCVLVLVTDFIKAEPSYSCSIAVSVAHQLCVKQRETAGLVSHVVAL